MGFFSKLFNLGEAGLNKAEEAIDDKFGVDIIEVKIKQSRERLVKMQDTIDSHEAKVNIDKTEIEAYKSQVAELETELENLKKLHDKADSEGRSEDAENFLSLGFETKAAIDNLHEEFAPKLESYEYALESIEENKKLIKQIKAEIERDEREISTIRSDQAMVDMHKAHTKLSDDIKGTSLGGQSAVSKLGNKKRQLAEEREKIRLKRDRKKDDSKSLTDRIAEAKSGSEPKKPW